MRWDERVGRRLKLKDLHMLEVIAKHGSMAKAAEDLAISQPAISKAMADLEHTLGVPLLDRSSRGVEVTECGLILLQRGRIVFDEIRQGLYEIQHLSDPSIGHVRVGTIEAMTAFVSTIIDRASRRYPRVTYQVMISDATTLLRTLRDRELDLVIARSQTTIAEDDLSAEDLFRDRLVIMAGQRHPLCARRKLLLAELMNERWTLSPPDSFLGRLVAQGFREHDLELPAATVTSISVQMRLNLLDTGRFLTVLPSAMLHHPGNRNRFKALPVDLRDAAGPIASITLRKRPATGAVKLFADATRAEAKSIASAR